LVQNTYVKKRERLATEADFSAVEVSIGGCVCGSIRYRVQGEMSDNLAFGAVIAADKLGVAVGAVTGKLSETIQAGDTTAYPHTPVSRPCVGINERKDHRCF
jgi:hypothetical protein